MNIKAKYLTLALSAVLATAAHADKPAPPRDYAVQSPGDKYVLVVLIPLPENAPPDWGKDPNLRAKYKESGVYLASDPSKPLYSLPGTLRQSLLSADGRSLVELGPWARNFSDEAFSIYREGKKVATYTIDQLVRDPFKVRRTVSHFNYLESRDIQNASDEFTIRTTDGGEFSFDLVTGAIKRGHMQKAPVGKQWEGMQGPENFHRLGSLVTLYPESYRDYVLSQSDYDRYNPYSAFLLGGPRVLHVIEPLLTHESAFVRVNAIWILNASAPHAYQAQFLDALNDPDNHVRLAAVQALLNTPERPKAIQTARAIIRSGNLGTDERINTLWGLSDVNELIPDMIWCLEQGKTGSGQAERWLEHNTFQHFPRKFPFSNLRLDSQEDLAKFKRRMVDESKYQATMYRAWYAKNAHAPMESWYRQGVTRSIQSLSGSQWNIAEGHLVRLTGHSSKLTSQSQAYAHWTKWWEPRKQLSPFQVIYPTVEAISRQKPERGKAIYGLEAVLMLPQLASSRDAAQLIQLYRTENPVVQSFAGSALSRLTGTHGTPFAQVDADQKAHLLSTWEAWAKQHPK